MLVGTGFTEFISCWRSITDLTGHEYCTDLTILVLGHNEISDICALAGLTNLEELVLSGNQIGDIHALTARIRRGHSSTRIGKCAR